MIHRRNRKQWLSKFFWGRRGVGGGGTQRVFIISNVKIVNVIFYCFAFSSTFVMNGRQRVIHSGILKVSYRQILICLYLIGT